MYLLEDDLFRGYRKEKKLVCLKIICRKQRLRLKEQIYIGI